MKVRKEIYTQYL